MKKLIVLFPGIRYSVDMPLLYYARLKYEEKGYESIAINYDYSYKEKKMLKEYIEEGKNYALKQLENIDFSQYEDFIFVSKSMGTVVAGWLEEKLKIKVRHIYLTPLEATLPYIRKEKDIITVVAGTKDKHINAEELKDYCKKEEINCKLIEGVGHRLEIKNNIERNIDILKEVIKLY